MKSSDSMENSQSAQSHVALNIIARCNQRCIFCFEGEREKKQDLPYEEAVRIIDDFADKVECVVFMGGEALLHKRIFDIIAHAKARGLHITLFTNGQRLGKRDVIEQCITAGLDTIHISINFHDEESFINITRTRSRQWNNLLKAFSNIDDYLRLNEKPTCAFNFHVLVFRPTIDHLEEIVLMLRGQLPHWTPQLCFKQLRAFDTPQDWADSLDLRIPLRELREKLPSLGKLGLVPPKLAFDGFPLCALPGIEYMSTDFQRAVSYYDIFSNFARGKIVSEMDVIPYDPLTDMYRFVCKDCKLMPFCLGTQTSFQWPAATITPQDHPIPHTGDISEISRQVKMGASHILQVSEQFRQLSLSEELTQAELVLGQVFSSGVGEEASLAPKEMRISCNMIQLTHHGGEVVLEVALPSSDRPHALHCGALYLYNLTPSVMEGDQAMQDLVSGLARKLSAHDFTSEQLACFKSVSQVGKDYSLKEETEDSQELEDDSPADDDPPETVLPEEKALPPLGNFKMALSLLEHLRSHLIGALPMGLTLHGFRIVQIQLEGNAHSGEGEIVLSLTRDKEDLALHIMPYRSGQPYYSSLNYLGLRYNSRTPLDTPEKEAVAHQLLHHAEQLAGQLK